MNAIRQFNEVKDHSFNVLLPKDFKAKSVEIIIIPNEEDDFHELSEEQKNILDERLLESEEGGFYLCGGFYRNAKAEVWIINSSSPNERRKRLKTLWIFIARKIM